MNDSVTGEVETAMSPAVRQATHKFARELAATAAFEAFEEAGQRMSEDQDAQRAIAAYQARQQALQNEIRHNQISPAQKTELVGLYHEMLAQPAVDAYMQAQSEFRAVCQAAAGAISQRIGLTFAACRGGCH